MAEKLENISLGSDNQTHGELVICDPPISIDEQLNAFREQLQLLAVLIAQTTALVRKRKLMENATIRRD